MYKHYQSVTVSRIAVMSCCLCAIFCIKSRAITQFCFVRGDHFAVHSNILEDTIFQENSKNGTI